MASILREPVAERYLRHPFWITRKYWLQIDVMPGNGTATKPD
jgi:hypothetical protein